MKKLFYSIAVVTASMFSLSSCENIFNTDETSPDGSVPHIDVKSPRAGAKYTSETSPRLSTIVSDKDEVKDLNVTVYNSSDETVFTVALHPNRILTSVDTAFAPAGLPAGDYTMAVTAKDGRTNEAISKVDFTVE